MGKNMSGCDPQVHVKCLHQKVPMVGPTDTYFSSSSTITTAKSSKSAEWPATVSLTIIPIMRFEDHSHPRVSLTKPYPR